MKKDELQAEVARSIIELKIVDLIKNNKERDFSKYKEKLQSLTKLRDEIYELNQDTIDRVYKDYYKEVKNEGN